MKFKIYSPLRSLAVRSYLASSKRSIKGTFKPKFVFTNSTEWLMVGLIDRRFKPKKGRYRHRMC